MIGRVTKTAAKFWHWWEAGLYAWNSQWALPPLNYNQAVWGFEHGTQFGSICWGFMEATMIENKACHRNIYEGLEQSDQLMMYRYEDSTYESIQLSIR